MHSRDNRTSSILLIEDEQHIAESLLFNLDIEGYACVHAADGLQALALFEEAKPDLVVLDLMLPGLDGYRVLETIRTKDERLPVLIISAKDQIPDKRKGFEIGGDDYLTKPFHLEEFLLRVKRLLTRAHWLATKPMDASSSERLDFGRFIVDLATEQVFFQGKELMLTAQEFSLLRLFVQNRGKVLSRKYLQEQALGYGSGVESRTIDNFIVRLRRYFEDDPREPRLFVSVRSRGYRFDG